MNLPWIVSIIDSRGDRYAAGYYDTLDEAKEMHDTITYGCSFWKNMNITISSTTIHKMEPH